MKRTHINLVSLAVLVIGAPAIRVAYANPQPHGVVLRMAAAKRIEATDANGHMSIVWQPVQDAASVVPGDVLRYTITGRNYAGHSVSGLAVTQPIPTGTEYVAGSATVVSGGDARLTASIDGGATFSERPMVEIRGAGGVRREAAPASRYTQLRWNFAGELPASGTLAVTCEVRVR